MIDRFNDDDKYKHATIVVDLHPKNENQYQKDRNSLQTLNHWQQMQAPSLAICKEGAISCAIDKIRPANKESRLKDGSEDYIKHNGF